ncbi:MAG: AAA family ATPase [Methylobacter tundripaludum]|nr:AAA family ATPase [Methylobacter tundripaludum]
MKIRKIKIKNYKIFDDLELDFTDSDGRALDTIVLAGINGSGKTSILQLLQKIFSEKSNLLRIQDTSHEFEKNKDAIICEELTIEFESSLDFIKAFIGLISSFKQQASKRKIDMHDVFPSMKDITSKLSFARNKPGDIKIFEFCYKIEKNKEKFTIKKNDFLPFAILSEDDISKYFNVLCFVASSFELNDHSKNKDFFEMISTNKQSYERNGIVRLVDIFSHKKEIEGYLVNSIIDAVLKNREITVKDAVNNRIEDINRTLKNINLNTKLINITSEKAIFESPNEKEISIDDLSSGEKQLYYRAVLLSKLNIKNSLILVDEPETSLHPTWQREVIKLYQNSGENNQVILATHSPHIIASVEPKNLFLLYFDDDERKVKIMNMEKEKKYTKGVEPNRILQEIMGVELRDEETQQRIDEIVTILRKNPEERNNLEFEEKLQNLIRDLGVQDPSIMRINHQLFLLNRKK